MRTVTFLLALCWISQASAHLLPSQHATFRFDDDKLYMVLAMSPRALDAACGDGTGASVQAPLECPYALVDFVADRIALFSAAGPAQLLDLRLAPTFGHDDPSAVDQVTALAVFRLPPEEDPLYLVLDIFSDEDGGDRYSIVVSNTTDDVKRKMTVSRAAPIVTLRDRSGVETVSTLEVAF